MLNKIEVLEKPAEVDDEMRIRLEPNIISGNDVLTVRIEQVLWSQPFVCTWTWRSSAASVWPSSAATELAKPPF